MKKIIFILSCISIFLFSTTLSAEEATESTDIVREKVREKVEQARLNPKAYIGTVTDKTNDSLQVKDLPGEIQLVAVKNTVSFVKTENSKTKVTFDDVAIGDFIVAMGLTNGNSVLEAKRILITKPLEPIERKVVLSEIGKIEGKTITLINKDRSDLKLTFPRRWKGPEIKNLKQGDLVIVIYVPIQNVLTVRTIQVLTPAPSPTPKN